MNIIHISFYKKLSPELIDSSLNLWAISLPKVSYMFLIFLMPEVLSSLSLFFVFQFVLSGLLRISSY